MEGKIKSEKYDLKKEHRITEEEILSTELTDPADNELYIRYKIAQANWPDRQAEAQKLAELERDAAKMQRG